LATIHLIEGPVGAGKSTFAGQLALTHAGVHLNLDEWMATLFSADRPEEGFMQWYAECKDRCISQIWSVTCALVDAGVNAILELGLVQLRDREQFYGRVDAAGYELEVYLLLAPKAVRKHRVQGRNADQGSTFKMEVSDEIFEIADSMWQAPDDDEFRDRRMRVISTGSG
jgi:predicted kinase